MTARSLFVALPVPATLVDQINRLPQKGLNNPRFIASSDLHLTLRYIGRHMGGLEDTISVSDIQNALKKVSRPPFRVVAKGLDIFRLKRHTVLYVAIESTKKLTALAAEINLALEPLGFEMPNKPFTPHVTIARLKKNQAQGIEDYIQRHQGHINTSWTAKEFAFYQSLQDPAYPGKYKIIKKYDLTEISLNRP